MEIADTFPMASFGGIEFPYTEVEITGSLDHHVHKYIHRPGGEVETLGRHLYEVSFSCTFDTGSRKWRNLYPQRLAELVALCESEKTYPLVIPTRGVRGMKAKAVKWTQGFTAKIRSGERARFTFLEDAADQFTAYQIVQFQAVSLPGYAPRLKAEAIKLGEPSIFDQIIEALARFEKALDDASVQVAKVLAVVDAVIGACAAVIGLAALANPTNWTAFEAVQLTWSAALELQLDVSGSNRIVDKYFVTTTSTVVEVSVAIYGNPGHVDELLSLNNFNDLLRIPPGAVVNYYVS